MNTTSKNMLFAIVLIGMLAVMAPRSAMATGTDAGTGITNNATLNYVVSGVTQSAMATSTTFTVDKKIIYSVSTGNTSASPLGVTPNTIVSSSTGTITTNVIAFTLGNTGNTLQNFQVSATDTGTLTPGSGTPKYYYEVLGTNSACPQLNTSAVTPFTPGATSVIPNVAKDTNACLYVMIDVPAGATDAQIRDVTPTVASSTSGGTALTNSGTAGTGNGIVIAMAGGTNSASAIGEFKVATASLSVVKSSAVYSDPFSASNPKAIPGAVVTYTITITNSGSSDATSVQIVDDLSTPINGGSLAYDTAFQGGAACSSPGIVVNGACSNAGVTTTWDSINKKITVSGLTVKGTVSNGGSAGTATILYQVTIQ